MVAAKIEDMSLEDIRDQLIEFQEQLKALEPGPPSVLEIIQHSLRPTKELERRAVAQGIRLQVKN